MRSIYDKYEDLFQHITQPTSNTCFVTSVAIATGLDLDVVMEIHDELFENPHETGAVLYKLKEHAVFIPLCSDQIINDRIYLAAVPSLNLQGCFHMIVLVGVGSDILVYDPAKGRLGSKYYVSPRSEHVAENEVKLSTWQLCYEVIRKRGL